MTPTEQIGVKCPYRSCGTQQGSRFFEWIGKNGNIKDSSAIFFLKSRKVRVGIHRVLGGPQ